MIFILVLQLAKVISMGSNYNEALPVTRYKPNAATCMF
jgi:hypothetical protein